MTLTFTILNNETNKVCKTLTAKSMNSIYTQYKSYCKTKNATTFEQCDQDFSFGSGYWVNSLGNKFTLHRV
jgi:hypothetical protein